MARGKTAKKDSLSIEERLEQALVPDWEQPYKVPENWVWTRGSSLFMQPESKKPSGKEFLYIDIDSIDNTNQKIREPKKLETSKAPSRANRGLQEGDTLFSLVRPYLKNIAYVEEVFQDAIASTGFYVCRPNNVNTKYIYWLMCSGYVVDGLNKHMKGDNSPSIRKDNIEAYEFPLPPLTEQQRIVDRIESLFAKLDEAKEKAQAALDSFETRKAAILHKAFTGELTQKWREENGVGLDSWEEKALKDICIIRAGHAFDSKKFSNAGHQVIRMGNLYNGELDLERNPVFMPCEEIDEKTFVKSIINRGDILLTLTGTKYKRDYGYAVLIDIAGLLLNQRIIAMTPSKINSRFLLFTLQSNYFRDIFFSNETGGVNQGNVSSKFVERIRIKYPTPKEQTEIVRILDSLFGKEQKAKELANVVEKIDLMKKAILARAFRGELGTNDPKEESAIELLKEIIAEKQPKTKTRAQATLISKNVDVQLKTNLEREVYRAILKNETVDMDILFGVTKNFNELMVAVNSLEKKGLIEKFDGRYRVQ